MPKISLPQVMLVDMTNQVMEEFSQDQFWENTGSQYA
jgi:hypothetical protein